MSGISFSGAAVAPPTPWITSDNTFLGTTADLAAASNTANPTAGSQYLTKYTPRTPQIISTLTLFLNTSGVGASSGSFIGVINQAGTLLATSADIGASLIGAPGPIPVALPTPMFINVWVWFVFLVNLATTQPIMYAAGPSSPWNVENANQTPANATIAVNGTGLTALQSINPASNNVTGGVAPRRLLIGVS